MRIASKSRPRRTRCARAILTGSVSAVVLAIACDGPTPKRGRVLLVGIDGATFRIIQPLLDQGRLPHLARIAEAGIAAPLRAHLPLQSPRIWTSIATGKLPEDHGILGFAREEDGARRLYGSADRKVHALWNIASTAGLTVAVVNWWNTYPLERIRGVMVSDHLLPLEIVGRRVLTGAAASGGRGPIVHPEVWQGRVSALLAVTSPLTEVPNPFESRAAFPDDESRGDLAQRYRNDQAVTRIALEIERDLNPDLLMVYLPGIDRVSHFLWGAIEPSPLYPELTAKQRTARARALAGYYEFSDALIGRLAARYGPRDLVLVVSDHGFEAGRKVGGVTGVHKSQRSLEGVIFARGPGVAAPSESRPVSVNDVTPTILAWLGLPLARDMAGRPAPFLEAPGLEAVATYDTAPIQRLTEAPSGVEGAILEQLRALGYFEHGASD